MRLLAKFSLIFTLAFGGGLAGAQARLMMETMRSARDYTVKQIVPLLEAESARERVFLPQTVAAFAATESFNYLRERYPDYEYKEATLNPTNLRDREVERRMQAGDIGMIETCLNFDFPQKTLSEIGIAFAAG
jgi:hypothetical protein